MRGEQRDERGGARSVPGNIKIFILNGFTQGDIYNIHTSGVDLVL